MKLNDTIHIVDNDVVSRSVEHDPALTIFLAFFSAFFVGLAFFLTVPL